MTQLDLSNRDRTVERMLILGGFNRATIVAVNAVIKSRMATQRLATAQTSAIPSSKSVAA